ncbi:hypothetical protein H5410_047694 [Solanum commersonii]|uniref:Uncharacterized protein n=1 Tax=Solanum commersonii TaxID=4109 RepID=A0A9J5XJ06_SOLCO|nr:hypothetical protein H5410_047694 [Solanum commersonii]
MADMQSRLIDLNLTNLSITLNTPLPEHGTNTATPPLFPHVDSPTPQYFPPNSSLHKTNPTASKQSTNPQQPNFPQNNPQQANPLPLHYFIRPKPSLTQTPPSKPTHLPKLPRPPKPPYLPKIPSNPTCTKGTQSQSLMFKMRLVYVMKLNLSLIQCQPCQKSIHMKRWRKKQGQEQMTILPQEISSANLKRKSDIPLPQPIPPLNQSFSKAFAAQGSEEAVEDNLTEGLKNLFMKKPNAI